MSNLDDESRVLLDLARDAHDPNDVDRGRVRAALASRLGPAAGLGLAVGLGVATKAAAATGAGATAKLLGVSTAAIKLVGAVALVSTTLGVGATVIHRSRSAPVASVTQAAKASARGPSGPSLAPTVAAPEAAPFASEEDTPKVDERSAARPVDTRPADTRPATAPAAKPAPLVRTNAPARSTRPAHTSDQAKDPPPDVPASSPVPAVANEARLIHEGVVALQSSQPTRALALFDAHALLYPHGVLAEEREAERALALADLGRTADARTAIEQFLRVYPASPLAPRLRARADLLAHPEP